MRTRARRRGRSCGWRGWIISPDAPKGNRDALGGMQHVAFKTTRAEFERAQRRLRAHAVDFVGSYHLGGRSLLLDLLLGSERHPARDHNGRQPRRLRSRVVRVSDRGRDPAELEDLYGSREAAAAILRTMPVIPAL